ncbi:MAG: AlwI family type II restriction endonuclease [Candidatus Gorgyraea atricola]|nr:AlwI family type II restriction endonuclease [Candidatus Gorgyraea atricola]
MRKPWSISTTVRNAERVRDFLVVLKELEGCEWSYDNQEKYQTLLIKNRTYGKTNQFFNDLSREQIKLLQSADKITYKQSEDIFNTKRYRDPAMRGRQSINPLKKLGLVKVENNRVHVTSLGNYLLRDDYDLGEMFFRSFLKWQLPNPNSQSFKKIDGFNIKPFIGTLHFIYKVNTKWQGQSRRPVGITKEEFCIFVPTLINFRHIDDQVNKLINLRAACEDKPESDKRRIIEKFKGDFVKEFLQSANQSQINQCLDNLRDYGDSIIRYFRLTRFIYIRGGGFYIDLEPRRYIEIEKLLEVDDASPLDFTNLQKYLDYIADITKPILPWENQPALEAIAKEIVDDVSDLAKDLKDKKIVAPPFDYKKESELKEEVLKEYVENLRNYRRELQDLELYHRSQTLESIQQCIIELENIYRSRAKKSIELERLITVALNALNDALKIKPNYPVGDDNQPTFTAPGNKPDIECFYDTFGAICEVTMRKDKSQWFEEGQPVMRHLRDFESSNKDKQVFCLFIAPLVHRDTLNTFWFAVRYEYEGAKQKIIPLSLKQFIQILKIFLGIKEKKLTIKHVEFLKLYESIVRVAETVDNSEAWLEKIPETIEDWKASVVLNTK